MFLPFKLRGLELAESRGGLADGTVLRDRRDCRTTGIWFTMAIARWAAPASYTRR